MVDRRWVLDGYVSGPAAATEATAQALAQVGNATSVILVEGVSDQIAVETLARALGRRLPATGVAVVPTGGVSGMGRLLARFGPAGGDPRRIIVLCHVDLEDELIRAVTPEGVERLLHAGGTLTSFRSLQHQQQWRDRPVHDQLPRSLVRVAAGRAPPVGVSRCAVSATRVVPIGCWQRARKRRGNAWLSRERSSRTHLSGCPTTS